MFYWLAKFVLLGPVAAGCSGGRGPRAWRTSRTTGRAILASNHLSFCDSFFMPLLVKRKVTFLAKAEYFTTPGIKGLLLADVLLRRRPGADRPRRRRRRRGPRSTPGVRVLREGKLLGIYPEGTRSPDGRLYRGKTGVARMALESGALVIPCAMIDTDKIQPPGRQLPKLRPRPGVRFGKPLDFSRYEGMAGDRFVERSMTDEIMYELMQLSGQEYVDQYAAKVKTGQGRTSASAPAGIGIRRGARTATTGCRHPSVQ